MLEGQSWTRYTSWVNGRIGGTKALANPKSASLRRPSRDTRMFCGFKSLRNDPKDLVNKCLRRRTFQDKHSGLTCASRL